MSWSYHRRIKIIPGVHLNLSKAGITTTFNVDKAKVSFKNLGTYSGNIMQPGNSLVPVNADNHPPVSSQSDDNIFSADIQKITSQNMQGIKEALLMAHEQRKDLSQDLQAVKRTLGRSKLKLNISYLLLYGLINKSSTIKTKADIKKQEEVILQINDQIDNSNVSLDVDFDPKMEAQYSRVVATFKQLTSSYKIWDVTSAHYQDRIAARSSASTIVSKREVRFGIKSIPEIRSNIEVLYLQNANGSDLYFYPGFIVMYASKGSFALIGIDELIFNHHPVRFTETGTVPKDSKIIDQTWAKVNKNGTPDKRFKENYQIPIVRYGELCFKTATGLHEEYECSNYEASEAFGSAFTKYQKCIQLFNKY
jgi:hypothetical protein